MKKTISVFLILVLLCGFAPAAFAAGDEAQTAADTLYTLGLFRGKGTDAGGMPVYDLDAVPTRYEAVTMLVRLLGKEAEANMGNWDIPFTDVVDWAKPYVGFAWAKGLTNGTGGRSFGGEAPVTASEYITFVLRALSYDSAVDFKWDAAWELSDRIGVTDGRYPSASVFTRGDAAIISVRALSAKCRDSAETLAQKLFAEGVFSAEQYQAVSSGHEDTAAPLSACWSADSTVSQSLRDYVSKVTNPKDPTCFIPEQDRIAVFDMDGTLTCETFYTYYDTMMFIEYCLNDHPEKVSDELKQVAASIKPGYTADESLARNFAKAYAGMTVEEFYQYAVEFGQKKTVSFENMRYIDGFYLPMVELVKYLYENSFTIYVISGTERTTTRAIVANSPIRDYVTPNHVIGTDFEVKQLGHETQSSNMDYKYENGDELVLTGGFVQKNLNANKSIYIEREIGQRPVLAFGNSGSDTSMLNYAIDSRNPYPAQAYMVVADDNIREWGTQDWAKKSAEYLAKGFTPISMKNDFAQIYPEGITRAAVQYQERDCSDAPWYQVTSGKNTDYTAYFPSWDPDSASLAELVDFVTGSTDRSSPSYLDPADRIAVFDMDGTILCEKAPVYIDYCLTMYRVLDDPTYSASEEERSAMQQIRDHAYSEGVTFHPEGLTKDDLVASAFAGMTPEEFRAYVVDFADHTDVVGFDGMTYGQSFYRPMVEVIDYLRANDFDVWMVSACEREVVRALVERFGIPYDHVIATDVPYVASGCGEKNADEYNMDKDETILLGAPLDAVECGKSGKAAAIAREIGKRPVLAFGNSSGDYSMLNYAEGNPKHVGMGFFVVCDDTEREYGSDVKASEYYSVADKQGWTAFSMANDWKTIYGDGVAKTKLPGAEGALSNAA